MLGYPMGDNSTTDNMLSSQLAVFQQPANRLQLLNAHDALFLIRNCFNTPKLLYTLCSTRCFGSVILEEYDKVIRYTFQVILNVDLSDAVWNQAILPVLSGGLGSPLGI
jgi:hypothetical protein